MALTELDFSESLQSLMTALASRAPVPWKPNQACKRGPDLQSDTNRAYGRSNKIKINIWYIPKAQPKRVFGQWGDFTVTHRSIN
ncbi:hypothetical protein SynSYN20_03326 [Synechococcus sp. SYN20]|nr:hypothetical protein SynSYN20_03326 [Synechococcus sp. SYN20]